MKIQYANIEDIRPYENNPRDNRRAIELVAGSIDNYGFLQPIVIDKSGVVIVGHTRLEAAKQLGLEQVPVVVADNLTQEEADAYRIIDNRVGELSYWDVDLLNEELASIGKDEAEAAGFTMEETGVFELVAAGDFIPEGSERTTFAMTLNFTKDEYEVVKNFEEQRGKEAIAEMVVDICREGGEDA